MASIRGDRRNRGAVADLFLAANLPRAAPWLLARASRGRGWLGSLRVCEFRLALFAIRRPPRKRHGSTKGANKNVVVEASAPDRVCDGDPTGSPFCGLIAHKSLISIIFMYEQSET